ncbi:MAG: hypothetical protein HF314_15650 [Ignavibacteria bacterium]|jgi:hypothetical protein|nr:hypothetical protein [Ignavibacteria bacterium]MCU7504514.1 hypothetical protein [Ignavibacteria bacterium]MCU7518433.1 hypothetical protein [Ignavibacteria bacterium]
MKKGRFDRLYTRYNMKKIMIFAAFILTLVFSPLKAQDTEYQDYHGYTHERETFNYFYSSLNPYGEWMEMDNNVFAWHPYNVGRNWQPYTVGRWAWTADGWYWDSYEPFGWATYHYGRWYFDDYYGWIWIPDDQWGPAWVEWRYSDDYIGWAPLPPYAVFDIHIGIHFTYDWHFPYSCWNFMPYRYFDGYDVHRYYVTPRDKYRLYRDTRYRNDYGYSNGRVINRGVDRQFVERRTGRNVQQRDIVQTRTRDLGRRTGDNNRVEVFRPGQQELAKTRDIRTQDIKRTERRSSLEVNKIERRIGSNTRREEINRNGRTTESPVVRENTRNNPGSERNPNVTRRPETNGNTTTPPRVENPNDRQNRQNQPNDQPRRERRIEKQGGEAPNVNPPVNRNENPRVNQTPEVRENRQPERRNDPQVRENRQREDRQGNSRQNSGERTNNNDRRQRR